MALADKVAIITGAGRGIGKAIAKKFAANGAKVALAARTTSEIEKLSEEINSTGGKALAITTDITIEAQVLALVEQTETCLGPVDILVNNVGAMILQNLTETSLEEWNRMLNINLTGSFLCAKAVLPSMIKRKTGRIINIGSLAGRRGYPEQGAYCAAKHGLVGLSKVLAIEGKPYNIRVNMVSPGGVLTGLSRELLESRGDEQAKEWITPEEIADGVYYIAVQEGSAATDELILRRYTSEPWR